MAPGDGADGVTEPDPVGDGDRADRGERGDRGAGRVEDALALLRSRGHRVTEARRAVLEVLATGEGHPSADELCARVHDRHPGIHRATVYRTVDRLTTLGVVTHVHIGGGATAYHLAEGASAREHLHAICDVCGRIIDLPGDLLDPVTTWLATEAGFTLAPAHVALSGTCATCRAAPHVPDGP